MAIAFDAASDFFDNAGVATVFNDTHVCTGSNLVLAASAYIDPNTGRTITVRTYNGVSMTEVVSSTNSSLHYLYLLVNPSTGSNTLSMTTSAVLLGNKQIGWSGTSYTGCAQTGQPDSFASNFVVGDTSTNFAVTTTVVAANCWLVGGAESVLSGLIGSGSAGANTIYRGAVGGNVWGADSNGTVATGARSLNFGKTSGSDNTVGAVMSIAPSVAATSNSNFFMFM